MPGNDSDRCLAMRYRDAAICWPRGRHPADDIRRERAPGWVEVVTSLGDGRRA